MSDNDSFPPQLAKVFIALRKGKHVSVEDGVEFRDLTQNQDQYTAILGALGYKLVKHHQNFFYLRGGNDLNTKGLRSVSLFLLILFQHLEDTKFDDPQRSWEKHLLERIFRIDDLPHFETVARRSLMYQLDLTPENLREKVLRTMNRLGFITLIGQSQFRFRSPVYRFVEVCLNFADVDLEEPDVVDEATSPGQHPADEATSPGQQVVDEASPEEGSLTRSTTEEDDSQWEDVEDDEDVADSEEGTE